MSLDDHPTVQKLAGAATKPPARLDRNSLFAIARTAGADDCGVVSIDDPTIEGERASILSAYPAARTLLSIVARMHREPVRSPARSIANHEFHSAGDHVDGITRQIVRQLEDLGVPAANPSLAFPMEMDDFPVRSWVVSHKVVAEAAGLGRMGIHRSVIHPRFGNFILLSTVLIGIDLDRYDTALDFNPCLSCKLCVAACPVGAIKPDGAFDFSSCLTHNYQQFMGGFVNWIEDIADSGSARDYADRIPYSETVLRWQSLSYRPNYNAAYCIAVCPAGEDVIGPYLVDRKAHLDGVVAPLQAKREPVYVVKGSDAADYVARRYPHKRIRFVRPAGRATTIENFILGSKLSFQRGKSKDLNARYHFTFIEKGAPAREVTFLIAGGKLDVTEGHTGKADLRMTADGPTWIAFLNKRVLLLRALATGKIRLRGSPLLLAKFGACFPR